MEETNKPANMLNHGLGASFTPNIIAWLIAIAMGVILPLFSQDFIANQIINLSSPLPTSVNEVVSTPTSSTMLLASLALFTLSCLYVIAIGFQIFFITKIQKIYTIFSFTLTIVGPIFIWLILPYLIIFASGK